MKRNILFSLLFLAFFGVPVHRAGAQSAVYYCREMGAVGYSFSDDETGHDLKKIKQIALKQCQDMGGKSCALVYATSRVGWGGFVRGKDADGNQLIFAVGHQLNERFAKSELKRKYLAANGIELNDVLLITWQAE